MKGVREKAFSKVEMFKLEIGLPVNVKATPTQGLLRIKVSQRLTRVLPNGEKIVYAATLSPKLKFFDLAYLSAKNSIDELIESMIEIYCARFLLETKNSIQVEISKYIYDNFKFCLDILQKSTSSKTVIDIHIHRARYELDNCALNEGNSGQQQVDKLFEEENFMGFPRTDNYLNLNSLLNFDIIDYKKFRSMVESVFKYEDYFGLVQVPPLKIFQEHAFVEAEFMDSCSICLEGFSIEIDVRKTPCAHVFHGACIAKWLWIRFTCPICRFSLVD